jgi:hypothetical protein
MNVKLKFKPKAFLVNSIWTIKYKGTLQTLNCKKKNQKESH